MSKQEAIPNVTSHEMPRGSQTGASSRGASDPFSLPWKAFDVFNMNPFSLMRRLTEEMDRAVTGTPWTPAVEISENGGKMAVRAELPGLKPADVKVEVDNGVLVIEGERKETREHKESGAFRSEHHYGHFYRGIPLPERAEVEHATAHFENGLLEITIPVPSHRMQHRRIPVHGPSGTTHPDHTHPENGPRAA